MSRQRVHQTCTVRYFKDTTVSGDDHTTPFTYTLPWRFSRFFPAKGALLFSPAHNWYHSSRWSVLLAHQGLSCKPAEIGGLNVLAWVAFAKISARGEGQSKVNPARGEGQSKVNPARPLNPRISFTSLPIEEMKKIYIKKEPQSVDKDPGNLITLFS